MNLTAITTKNKNVECSECLEPALYTEGKEPLCQYCAEDFAADALLSILETAKPNSKRVSAFLKKMPKALRAELNLLVREMDD